MFSDLLNTHFTNFMYPVIRQKIRTQRHNYSKERKNEK